MHYADFIKASKKGMKNDSFIMHRCHGITTDINASATRAVTKMKATITQRFIIDNCEVDAESDCRFCFFWLKVQETGEWKTMLVRHWYEKDKLLPVDPRKIPQLDDERLATYPAGYRNLAYCQETTMGVKVANDMPGHMRYMAPGAVGRMTRESHDMLYWKIKKWLDGESKI